MAQATTSHWRKFGTTRGPSTIGAPSRTSGYGQVALILAHQAALDESLKLLDEYAALVAQYPANTLRLNPIFGGHPRPRSFIEATAPPSLRMSVPVR